MELSELTKELSHKLCIEHWVWLAKTGLPKEKWPRYKEFPFLKDYKGCFLCAFYSSRYDGCIHCPLDDYDHKEGCMSKGLSFSEWGYARECKDIELSKKYGAEFRDQLKEILRP